MPASKKELLCICSSLVVGTTDLYSADGIFQGQGELDLGVVTVRISS